MNKNPLSSQLKQKIIQDIQRKLDPPLSQVYPKLAAIQLIAGLVILCICPQFHLGFFPHSPLFHLLMNFGEVVCNFTCGLLFIGSGALLSLKMLNKDEIRKTRSVNIFTSLTLSLASLALFVTFGVEIQWGMFLIWIGGAYVGSFSTYEGHHYWQRRIYQTPSAS
jgi:hypothetical protein